MTERGCHGSTVELELEEKEEEEEEEEEDVSMAVGGIGLDQVLM